MSQTIPTSGSNGAKILLTHPELVAVMEKPSMVLPSVIYQDNGENISVQWENKACKQNLMQTVVTQYKHTYIYSKRDCMMTGKI